MARESDDFIKQLAYTNYISVDFPKSQPVSDEYSSGALLIELLQGALEFALNEGFSYSELGEFLNLYLQTLMLVIQGE